MSAERHVLHGERHQRHDRVAPDDDDKTGFLTHGLPPRVRKAAGLLPVESEEPRQAGLVVHGLL